MALIIYGSPRARTMRIFWTAAEHCLDFAYVPRAFDDPAGAVPALL